MPFPRGMGTTRIARADVPGLRQRTQYTCMATSVCAALLAHGKKGLTEDIVNDVMGASPLRGASWEQALSAIQYFGCRGTLMVPTPLGQLREWTDNALPVLIAWNPEGRKWSHASVVFDVDDVNVHIMDPNIPDPEETVRVVPIKEFLGKWHEDAERYMVRRPALVVELEISEDGKQTRV